MNGNNLGIVPKVFTDDKEVVLRAVAKNRLNLSYASRKLKNDKEIVMQSVTYNGMSLQ
jgi:hypothetical protein